MSGIEPAAAGGGDDSDERLARRTTISDVARTANVSIGTVSKVLNGRGGVGPDTRARVEEIAGSLGYVSVIDRRSRVRALGEQTIEVVVEPMDVANPYLTTLLAGAMEVAGGSNASLLLRPIASIEAAAATGWAQSLARSGRVGVIEVTSAYSAKRENALRSAGLPMILIDPIDRPRPSTPSIGATNWAGAYGATQYLLSLGHRRIQYIGGPPRATCDIVRGHGWAAAMTEAGISVSFDDIPRHSFTFEHGFAAATRLLTSSSPPTAIFAGSDYSAMGVLHAARRLGLSVPEDLSVIGFDDITLASTSAPLLTTVHQPIADIGRTAVRALLQLSHHDQLPQRRIELATSLVVRDSTAPPRS